MRKIKAHALIAKPVKPPIEITITLDEVTAARLYQQLNFDMDEQTTNRLYLGRFGNQNDYGLKEDLTEICTHIKNALKSVGSNVGEDLREGQ